MNYVLFIDQHGNEKIINIQMPVFVGTIKDSYDVLCEKSSKNLNGKKICIDAIFSDCSDSKLESACKEGLEYYFFQKRKKNMPLKEAFKNYGVKQKDFVKWAKDNFDVDVSESEISVHKSAKKLTKWAKIAYQIFFDSLDKKY